MRKIVLTIITVLALAGLTLVLWNSGSAYDPFKVYANLRAMREPYQAVSLSCCTCGHLGVRVVGADGKTNRFAIVAGSRTKSTPDGMFMWDAESGHDTNVTAVAMNADTRRMLVSLVERQTPPGFNREQGLILLRGDPRDHVAAIGHGLAAWFKDKLSK